MTCCGKVEGAVRFVQAFTPVGRAEDVDVQARRRICEECGHWDHGMCLVCECFTWAKTRLMQSQCPLENPKWTKITVRGKTQDGDRPRL